MAINMFRNSSCHQAHSSSIPIYPITTASLTALRNKEFCYFSNFSNMFVWLSREQIVPWTLGNCSLALTKDRVQRPFTRVGAVQRIQVMAIHL